jgi:hypothetical protein
MAIPGLKCGLLAAAARALGIAEAEGEGESRWTLQRRHVPLKRGLARLEAIRTAQALHRRYLAGAIAGRREDVSQR